jgi:tetratricopeptide (TPR) repeat protein
LALAQAAAVIAAQHLYAAGQQGLLQSPGASTAAGPVSIDDGRLASASLLTFSVDDTTVAAHRLTMRVAVEREALDQSLAGLGAGLAGLLSAVAQSLAEPWQHRIAARDAIQQITALHEHLAPYLAEQDAALSETLLQLRGWAIWCLNDLGDSSGQAIEYGQDLVAYSEQILGDTHPDTLTSRNNLAAYRAAGRLAEALPLYERTLADSEQILGDTHPSTLTSRNNLANAYQAAGRLAESESLRNHAEPE